MFAYICFVYSFIENDTHYTSSLMWDFFRYLGTVFASGGDLCRLIRQIQKMWNLLNNNAQWMCVFVYVMLLEFIYPMWIM